MSTTDKNDVSIPIMTYIAQVGVPACVRGVDLKEMRVVDVWIQVEGDLFISEREALTWFAELRRQFPGTNFNVMVSKAKADTVDANEGTVPVVLPTIWAPEVKEDPCGGKHE